MFLQLVEMEQKTCTIRLAEKDTGKQGVLFFQEGDLLDARADGLRSESAAYEIFSWSDVNLSIQNSCPQSAKRIQTELQAVLLEAMRLKDEREQGTGPEEADQELRKDGEESDIISRETNDEGDITSCETETPLNTNDIAGIRGVLQKEIGEGGFDRIWYDNAWDGLMGQMARVGSFFKAGELKLGYIDGGDAGGFVLVPNEETVVISVSPNSPRDRIMRVLGE
jgi:hypothetical protein